MSSGSVACCLTENIEWVVMNDGETAVAKGELEVYRAISLRLSAQADSVIAGCDLSGCLSKSVSNRQ